MSLDYAGGLSYYEDKGTCGLPETFDSREESKQKISVLANWIQKAKHVVVHTGAGISTSAGIPDFRGPKGVWTLEKKGLDAPISISWDKAIPTKTHMALKALVDSGIVQFIVSQNIDGLHLRSGIPRHNLSELHGNMFIDKCGTCDSCFVRGLPSSTVGQKTSDNPCFGKRSNGRSCRGKIHDFTLDWEHELPIEDLKLSESHSLLADLSIVLGSTCQINPSGSLPTLLKKYSGVSNGKLVVINLQPTKIDKKSDLIIRDYVDNVFELLFSHLNLDIPEYDPLNDPVSIVKKNKNPDFLIRWNQSSEYVSKMSYRSSQYEKSLRFKRKNEIELKTTSNKSKKTKE